MTPDEARRLLDGTTPGPWYAHADPDDPDGTFIHDELGHMCIAVEPTGSAYRRSDLDMIAAAPTLAAMIAGMREEWGVAVTYPGLAEVVEWGFCTRDGAEAEGNALDAEYRIVRRYVTEPEEA